MATTTKSLVLEHFDAFTLVYDHKPVAIEIKGSQMSRAALSTIPRLDKQLIQSRVQKEFGQAVRYAEMQDVPHWSMNQHEHRRELSKIIHEATGGVASTKIKPRKPYATDAILEVSAHRARLIRTKHREEQQVKRFDRQRVFAAWREVAHWVAGHRRPTHVSLDTFGEFKPRRDLSPFYHKLWQMALQAVVKAGKAGLALRGYQRLQTCNFKEAMPSYLADLVKQAAVVSVDWWDKLKPLRINTKWTKVPQYLKPIPDLIDKFGVPFLTAQQ